MNWFIFLIFLILPVIPLILFSGGSGGFQIQPGERHVSPLVPIQCDTQRTSLLQSHHDNAEKRLNNAMKFESEGNLDCVPEELLAVLEILEQIRNHHPSAIVELNIAAVSIAHLGIAQKKNSLSAQSIEQWKNYIKNALERADILLQQSETRYIPDTKKYRDEIFSQT